VTPIRLRRLLGAAVAAAIVATAPLPDDAVRAQQAAKETKDRVTNEELKALVAEPLALAADGHVAQSDAGIRALVADARGRADTVRAADLLMGYAVGLYRDPGTRRAAVPWLAQAAAAAEAAWGPAHPETALALQTYADGARRIDRDAPPPEAERALRQVLAIRVQALGADNGETVMTMRTLAETLAAGPAAATPDPRRAAEAAALFTRAIFGIPGANMQNPDEEMVAARLAFARLSARAGRPDDALAQFDATRSLLLAHHRSDASDDAENACRAFLSWGPRVYEALVAHGSATQAERLRRDGEAIERSGCAVSGL
jgi:hypothetical protein